MLSLSQRYATAVTKTEQLTLLSAGEALLAIDNPGALFPGTGYLVSLLLVTLASVMMAVAMVRSDVFSRASGYVGLVAELIQLTYFVALAVAPGLLALPPSLAAPFRLAWYIMVGRRLLQLGASPYAAP